MVSFTAILLPLLPLLTSALPTAPSSSLAPRENFGDITFYNTGLGACGFFNNDEEYVVAVSAALFDSQSVCGRSISVNFNGRSVNAQVVDRCAGCAFGDVDLSPRAFSDLTGSLDAGRVQGSWDFI
ncbi:expansin-like protein [Trichoderma virens Gv29-8]|uniref:Expansin-like protein n=1 Tax=Hypocrea virens (strain Gv29-8 / FGSC 10586) TaxID=413071 RepID=G9N494_HYPVG|nr:expansin-like protein [Trichoderma virens Gv29-8]EHK18420.1 expansin-like protein [Trichoderma virens Gv29-8]